MLIPSTPNATCSGGPTNICATATAVMEQAAPDINDGLYYEVPLSHSRYIHPNPYFGGAWIWGLGAGGTWPIPVGENLSAGYEVIHGAQGQGDAHFIVSSQPGQGSVSLGAGANIQLYGGFLIGYDDVSDYTGFGNSAGITLSILGKGVVVGGIWSDVDRPVLGLIIGYAPGARASIWYSRTHSSQLHR